MLTGLSNQESTHDEDEEFTDLLTQLFDQKDLSEDQILEAFDIALYGTVEEPEELLEF